MITKTITHEDLMDAMHDMMNNMGSSFMKLESHLNGRMDKLDGRMGSLEGRIDGLEQELQAIKAKLLEHDLRLADLRQLAQELTDKHSAYINDIADILDRITSLEKQMPYATKEELYELQVMLQKLVDWAIKAAKTVKVPLNLP